MADYGYFKDSKGNKKYINDDSIYHEGKNLGEVINSKQDKLTAGTGIEITGENTINNIQGNYSTEEVKIGTWIDGKPLYRKVFELGTFTSVVSKSPASLNFSVLINQARKVEYNIYNNTNFFNVPANSYDASDNNHFIYSQLGVRDNSYIVFMKSNRTLSDNYRVNVILEYTKTTD